MPFPNEHVARIRKPRLFEVESFRRDNIAKGIDVILGKIKGEDKEVEQSYRFSKDIITAEQAEKWLKDNNVNYILFDHAQPQKKNFDAETFSITKDIFSVGEWNGDKYTIEDIDNIVENFEKLKKTIKVPLIIDLFKNKKDNDQRHGGQPAFGWITELKRVGNKMYANISNIPRAIKEMIEKKNYRQVSIELLWNLKQGTETFRRVLAGVALLGVEMPGVENLDEFGNFYAQVYDAESKKAYEKEAERKEYTSSENEDPDPVVKAGTEKQKMEADAMELKELEAKARQLEKDKADADARIIQLEKDKLTAEATVKANADKAVELANSQRKAEAEVFVSSMVVEGKVLPKHKEYILEVMAGLDNAKSVKFTAEGKSEELTPLKAFEAVIADMPNLVKFATTSEKGKEKSEDILKEFTAKTVEECGNVGDQKLDFLAERFMSANKKADGKTYEYSEALDIVTRENPEIAKESGK